jgi:antitoxin (DNA-binding transcriptional repressor) of toxin-antitoxin stability system
MYTVDVNEAQTRLSDLIGEVAEGREVVISRADGAAVRLVPVTPEIARPRFGSARGFFTMADDFEAPLEDLAPYEQ